MKRASSLNFLNKSTEETTQVLYSSQLQFHSGNSIFRIKYRVQVIVCYLTEYAQRFLTQILTRPDLPAGCQLWTLRQQGAKRQQRRPIQTQLPARLDRRREAEAARGGEAVCSSVWSNYTLKAQRQIKHFAPAAYFFKEHWGGGKALAPHSRSSSETPLLRCIKRCHRSEKRIFRYTFTSMLLTSSWNICTWTPRVFSGGFWGFFHSQHRSRASCVMTGRFLQSRSLMCRNSTLGGLIIIQVQSSFTSSMK